MGICLTGGFGWNSGYLSIAVIQIVLTVALFISLPMWKKMSQKAEEEHGEHLSLSMRELIKLPGAKAVLCAFFCYCALESTTGLWASSYLVLEKGISAEKAATWASLFYLGITIGRLLSGFITNRLGDKKMVRLGQVIAGIGVIILFLPLSEYVTLVGLIAIGLGCAPIYPSLLHETPENFGPELSQAIMGMQMACAYVGSTFMPPVFGFIAEHISIRFYPLYLLLFVAIMVMMVEKLNKVSKKEKANGAS